MNTQIYSVAEGEVVYSGTMSMPGKNIIIDHGQGIFSRYFHLNNLLVKAKQKIKKGEKIALSGATGRVEAPHLHWEMAWKGMPLDPQSFLQVWAQFCDPK
jgi:murein DD-endopeptidase MepM/ murein hydrolase activator NlpD